MIVEELPEDVYRYERKFLLDELDVKSLEMMIQMHPAFFRELYPQRSNNNIYYDTPGFDFYRHNVEGYANRLKVRIRWYGDLWGRIEKPVLEFKVKNGLVGRKPTFKLKPFDISPDLSGDDLVRFLDDPAVPEGVRVELLGLKPALINRYRRKYFLSADGRFRLTLDTFPEFFVVPPFRNAIKKSVLFPERLIMEIKFIQKAERDIDQITRYFPFRMTKSSKYVDGVDSLDLAIAGR